METANVIFPQETTSILPAKKIDKTELEDASDEKKKQVAKDFESLLLNNLFDQMKNTIGEWGFDKDGASNQIDGIFWLYLARDMADKGGIGLWKDIYNSMTNEEHLNKSVNSFNGNL